MTDDTQSSIGHELADLCASKAARVADFDAANARAFVLGWLRRYGPMSGEKLTDAAIQHGHVPHDMRAFGAVMGALSRRGFIRCVGYCERRKGHGTAGGRVWEATC